MRKYYLNLIYTFCVIILLITIVPLSTCAENNITYEKINQYTNSLPDLIITDIQIRPGTMPREQIIDAVITNIGSGPSGLIINIRTEIKWLFLGILPLKRVHLFTSSTGMGGGINPGDVRTIEVTDTDGLPQFGSYRFYLTVNPDMSMEEEQYHNNQYSDDLFVLLGKWKIK
jgi:hypothetical protein